VAGVGALRPTRGARPPRPRETDSSRSVVRPSGWTGQASVGEAGAPALCDPEMLPFTFFGSMGLGGRVVRQGRCGWACAGSSYEADACKGTPAGARGR
jgi:hypothetical protein